LIRAQHVAEFYELEDDDASHKDMYSVWKQVPEIAVGEKVQYDEINSKRKIELQPAKSPGRRQSKGRNKGTVITKGANGNTPTQVRS
jgi:hypothetical protein